MNFRKHAADYYCVGASPLQMTSWQDAWKKNKITVG